MSCISATLFVLISLPAFNLCLPSEMIEAMWPRHTGINGVEPTAESVEIKKIFLFHSNSVTWDEAEGFCVANQMHLATVTNKQENDELRALLKTHGILSPVWIGATDLAQEGRFYWTSNGAVLAYENWDSTEPNNYSGHEHCVAMVNHPYHSGTWWDLNCGSTFGFACQAYVRS